MGNTNMRIVKEIMFMQIADIISGQSTCARLQVGSILVNKDKIISIGYNGVASKQIHCKKYFEDLYSKLYYHNVETRFTTKGELFKTYEDWLKTSEFDELHRAFSNENELHAEANCILHADSGKISNSALYTTISPCIYCAKMLVSLNIQSIYYKILYDRDGMKTIKFLQNNNIKCININYD